MRFPRYKTNFSSVIIVICLLLMLLQPGQIAIALHAHTRLSGEERTTYTVTNTNDSGTGSLRWAINQSNSNPGFDYVEFNIPKTDFNYDHTTGVWTIFLLSTLPALNDTNGVGIYGESQTIYQGDTNSLGPEIAISGYSIPSGPVFRLIGDSNWISTLSIHSNKNGAAIEIASGSISNTFYDNYIGIRADRSLGWGNKWGVQVLSGSHSNYFNKNVIAHTNAGDGIAILGPGGNNAIYNNIIGLDPTKSVEVSNQGHGISLVSSHDNLLYNNVISGNKLNGVLINSGFFNEVTNNVIGMDGARTKDLGNGGHGILLSNTTRSNTVNENKIAGNNQDGIRLQGDAHWNTIQENIIGVNKFNVATPNGWHGIGIYDNSYDNLVGSKTDILKANMIYESSWSGVAIVNNANYNTVGYNLINRNNYYGVAIVNSKENVIKRNELSSNGVAGVQVSGVTAIHNTITQNSIYSNATGITLENNANQNINTPVITAAGKNFVHGNANPWSVIEIFSDKGNQGEYYEGQTTANGTGFFSYAGIVKGPKLTVTQTDSVGNTSKFSNPFSIGSSTFLPLIMR